MVHEFTMGYSRCAVCGYHGTVYHWGDFRLVQSMLPGDAEDVCFQCLLEAGVPLLAEQDMGEEPTDWSV